MGRRSGWRGGRPARGPHEEAPGRPDAPAKMRRPERQERLERGQADAVAEHVRRAVELSGFDIISARVSADRRVRVMIETPGGAAVTIADCARASRAAETGITVAQMDPGSFEIEVESPGADRPLTRPADFERFKDQQVTVSLKEAREGRRNFTGRLLGRAESGDVTAHVLDEQEPQVFKAADIREVRLHPELKLKPKE